MRSKKSNRDLKVGETRKVEKNITAYKIEGGQVQYRVRFRRNGQELGGVRDNLAEAREYLATLKTPLVMRRAKSIKLAEATTLRDALSAHLEFLREGMPVEGQRRTPTQSRALTLLAGFGENMRLSELTLERINQYLKKRREGVALYSDKGRRWKELSDISLLHEIRLLRAATDVYLKKLPDGLDLYEDADIPTSPRVDHSSVEPIPLEHLQLIIDHLLNFQKGARTSQRKTLAQLIVVAAGTALRRGELAQIRWNDINFKNRTLIVRKEISKNGERREVPLRESALLALQQRKAWVFGPSDNKKPLKMHASSADGNSLVFPISPDGISRGFARLVKEVKAANPDVPQFDDYNFHALRHTAISMFCKLTGSIKAAQKIAGHKTLQMTMRYFMDDRSPQSLVDEALGKSPAGTWYVGFAESTDH